MTSVKLVLLLLAAVLFGAAGILQNNTVYIAIAIMFLVIAISIFKPWNTSKRLIDRKRGNRHN